MTGAEWLTVGMMYFWRYQLMVLGLLTVASVEFTSWKVILSENITCSQSLSF
jgi:hypothetical protein